MGNGPSLGLLPPNEQISNPYQHDQQKNIANPVDSIHYERFEVNKTAA
jgi:hypothetical protein